MGKSWALRNSSTLEKSFGFQHRFFLPYTLVNFATFCSLFFPSYKWRFLIQRRKNSRLNSGLKSFAGKSKKYRRCWLELCCKTLLKQLRQQLSAKCFSAFDRAVIEQASKRLKIELVRESISSFFFFSLTNANAYHPLINRVKIQWIPRKHLCNHRRIPWKKHSAKHEVLFSPCLGWEKWKKKKWLEPWSTGTGVFFPKNPPVSTTIFIVVCIHTGGATVHEAEEKRAALGEQYRDGHWPSSSFFILSQRLPSSRSLFSPPLSTECFKNLDLMNIRESFRSHL